ncbi:SH3 domain-containing protein [Lysobacter silvisoli]|uniref:Peptide-binding protein n=1 Tax=Lysobacter silvisoli TaxID=2293254 RepID=A0A371JZU6_9GAMM|nr:SH3 domain-containing protein [Lysobacter silvisoli]RDZ27189.1 peptide-binding protein [Lysobacter silvisoli]
MRRARVVVAHRAPDRPPIRVARGQRVTLGDRDRDWPQFVWTTLAEGHGGWVPAALFDGDHGPATALNDYDTRELDAEADEIVTLQYELADWWWASNARGDEGWIPTRALDLIDEDGP